MAKNKVYVDVIVDDKGTTKKVALSAKKAAKALDSSGRAAQTADRNLKGVAQASANGTKNFAKMSQGIGGKLVPAYATLAANIFAVTAAFNAFRRSAQLEELETNLVRSGNVIGQNFKGIADNLKELTGSAIDTEMALRTVAQGTSQGFSASQLQDLTKVAKGASIALGRELPDSLDRLVRGTAKLEPEILDELGIIVRLDDAATAYATSLGKTASQLTAFERQQAFANAVTEQGLKKFGEIADAAEINPYDKLAASFSNLTKVFFEGLNSVLKPIVEFLSENPTGLVGVISIFASTIINQLTPALSEMAEEGRTKFSNLNKAAKKAAASVEDRYTKALKNLKNTKISPAGFKALEGAIRSGTASAKDFEKGLKSLQASERKRLSDLKKLEAATKGLRGAQKAAHLAVIAEKQKELALIQAQIKATQTLKSVDRTRAVQGPTARRARQAGASARVGRTEAAASRLMESSGAIKSFQIAGAAAARMSKQVFAAGGVLGGLATSFKVAGAAARLFGAAILNAIPIIGQILFIGTLAYEALTAIFGNPFEATAVEQAVDSVKEKMKELEKAALDVSSAMKKASTTGEAAFIKLKAGIGRSEQGTSALQNFIDATQQERNKNLEELSREAAGDIDTGFFSYFSDRAERHAAMREIERESKELGIALNLSKENILKKRKEMASALLQEEKKSPVLIPKEDALESLRAVRAALAAEDLVDPRILNSYDKFIEGLNSSSENAISLKILEGFEESLEQFPEQSKLYVGAIEGLASAAADFDTQFTSFLQKSNTPFTNLSSSADVMAGTFKTLADTIGNTSFTQENFNQQIEKLGGEGAVRFAKFLKSTEAYQNATGTEAERLKTASAAYAQNLKDADEGHRQLQTSLEQNKTEQQKIADFSKDSVFFLQESIKLEKDALDTKKNQLQKQLGVLSANSKDLEVIRQRKALEDQIAALNSEQARIQTDKVRSSQVLFNQKRQELDIANKLIAAQKEEFEISQKNLKTYQQAALREARQENPLFDLIDNGRTQLNQEIEALEAKIKVEKDTQEAIVAMKQAVIAAEYELLRAQLLAQKKAVEDSPTPNIETPLRDPRVAEARRLQTLIDNITKAQKTATTNINAAASAALAAQEEELRGLIQSRDQLLLGGNSKERVEQELEIQNKLNDALREQFNIQQTNIRARQDRDLRVAGENPFFEYVDQGKMQLNQEIKALEAKIEFERTTQESIVSMKEAVIRAEYGLLRAQLSAQKSDMLNAKKEDGSFVYDETTRAAEAARLDGLMGSLTTAENTAVENVLASTDASIGSLQEKLEGLKESRRDLEDINVLTDGIANSLTTNMESAFNSLITGTKSAKDAFADMAVAILKDIAQMITRMLVLRMVSSFMGSFGPAPAPTGMASLQQISGATPGAFGRNGGIFSQGKKLPGYATGGIARGSDAGYPAVLHGTEAVVPLPNNRSIPVDLKGAGQQNNVTVNVSVDGNGNAQQDTQASGNQAAGLGNAIAAAVQKELLNQKRNGGILSPYGA